jgi:ankyrin repeat protein
VAALWLCQAGADVTALKDDGWRDTALHYAAARGHTEVCKVLLAFGALVEAQNYAGLTPAQTAARSGHTRLSELLAGAAAGKKGFKFSPKNLPAPLRRKLAASVSQYQQEITSAATAAGAGAALAAAAGATVPLNPAGERSKPVTPAAVMAAAADAAARAAPVGSSAAAAGLDAKDVAAAAVAAATKLAGAAAQRGWEGAGSQGTELVQGTRVFRVLAVMSQVRQLTLLRLH